MKRISAIIAGLMGVASLACASNDFSYTATATPGSAPDGTDQNNNPLSVWTIAQNPGVTGGGISGAYFGTSFGGETLSGWQIWSSPNNLSTGDGGFIEASNIFAGGGLNIGQTVSINFEMRAVDPGPRCRCQPAQWLRRCNYFRNLRWGTRKLSIHRQWILL